MTSTLSAAAIGTLAITGDLTGSVQAASARSIRVTGNVSNLAHNTASSILLTGALGQLNVGGSIDDATVSVGGNIGSIIAGSIVGSIISTTGASIPAFTAATSANLGANTITSIRLTGKAGDQFTGSSILSSKIGSASLGNITAANSGTNFGLAVRSINSFSGIFSGNALRANRVELANDSVLSAFAGQQGVSFGDFEILITG